MCQRRVWQCHAREVQTKLRLLVTRNEQENLSVFVCGMEIPVSMPHHLVPITSSNLIWSCWKRGMVHFLVTQSVCYKSMLEKNWRTTPEYEPGWHTALLCFSLYAEVSLQGVMRSFEIMYLSPSVQLPTSRRRTEFVEYLKNCLTVYLKLTVRVLKV